MVTKCGKRHFVKRLMPLHDRLCPTEKQNGDICKHLLFDTLKKFNCLLVACLLIGSHSVVRQHSLQQLGNNDEDLLCHQMDSVQAGDEMASQRCAQLAAEQEMGYQWQSQLHAEQEVTRQQQAQLAAEQEMVHQRQAELAADQEIAHCHSISVDRIGEQLWQNRRGMESLLHNLHAGAVANQQEAKRCVSQQNNKQVNFMHPF